MYILLYVQKSVHVDDAHTCSSLTFMLLYVQESVHDDDTCTMYIVHAVIQESVHDDDTCTCQGTGAEASSRLSPRCKGDTVTRAF